LALAGCGTRALAAEEARPNSRKFTFTYQATVTGLKEGQTARIWLPVPTSSLEQEVNFDTAELPKGAKLGTESTYGNRILYLEGKADADGMIPVSVTCTVTRKEVKGKLPKAATEDLKRFLAADTKVPVGGKTLVLLKDRSVPEDRLDAGRLFYDLVNSHMTYAKDTPGWGQGDSVWACDHKRGNCSD